MESILKVLNCRNEIYKYIEFKEQMIIADDCLVIVFPYRVIVIKIEKHFQSIC